MSLKKLSKTAVFILPLIDRMFTQEYLLINTKAKDPYKYNFVNAYLTDLNNTSSKNCLYLVYRTISNNKAFLELIKSFRTYSLTKSIYSLLIDRAWHTVICLQIPDTISMTLSINSIKNSQYSWLSYSEKIRIMSFWNSCVGSVLHSCLFNSGHTGNKFDDTGIPKQVSYKQERLQGLIPKEPFSFVNVIKKLIFDFQDNHVYYVDLLLLVLI